MSRADIVERPILFSVDMIRAILQDCGWRPDPDPDKQYKAMTRRTRGLGEINANPGAFLFHHWDGLAPGERFRAVFEGLGGQRVVVVCPFGHPGDHLWVRKTWAEVVIPSPSPKCRMVDGRGVTYRADWNGNPSGYRWKPSIHMPRWASRILLVTAPIRLERLQDITDADAMAEGLRRFPHKGDFAYSWKSDDVHGYGSPRGAFFALWDSLNAARGLGVDRNPWVWVVEFGRVQP